MAVEHALTFGASLGKRLVGYWPASADATRYDHRLFEQTHSDLPYDDSMICRPTCEVLSTITPFQHPHLVGMFSQDMSGDRRELSSCAVMIP